MLNGAVGEPRQGGFTLIETMVAVLVLSITGIITMTFLISTDNDTVRAAYRANLNDTAASVAQELSQQLRSSYLVPVPTCTSSCTATSTIYLLEQTGVSSQNCVEWTTSSSGSTEKLLTGSWPVGGTAKTTSQLGVVGYLASADTAPFTITGTVNLSTLAYALQFVAVAAGGGEPSGTGSVTISDTLAARNLYNAQLYNGSSNPC